MKDATKAEIDGPLPKSEPTYKKGTSTDRATTTAKPKVSAGVWQRFTAFVTGVGVASAVLFLTVQKDIWESTEAIEKSIGGMKSDSMAVNKELRERVAVLEHEIATFKRDLQQ